MSLVLTRRPGERIMIGNDIVVTVVGINGGQIRIAVEAPKDVRVDREEVAKRIADEKVAPASHQGVVAIRRPAAAIR